MNNGGLPGRLKSNDRIASSPVSSRLFRWVTMASCSGVVSSSGTDCRGILSELRTKHKDRRQQRRAATYQATHDLVYEDEMCEVCGVSETITLGGGDLRLSLLRKLRHSKVRVSHVTCGVPINISGPALSGYLIRNGGDRFGVGVLKWRFVHRTEARHPLFMHVII